MTRNIVSDLIAPLASRPEHLGIQFRAATPDGAFWSYRRLYKHAARLAQAYRAQGVRPGSRIILPFANTAESIAAFLALVSLGAIPFSVRVPTALAKAADYPAFLSRLQRDFAAEAMIDCRAADHPGIPLRRLLPAAPGDAAPDALPSSPARPGDLAFVQFSSGTTSAPKGVPIQHGQLLRQLELIVAQDGRRSDDVGATWLPLFHDMGLIGSLLSSLYAGHFVYMDTPSHFLLNSPEWLAELSRHRITMTALPNFGLDYLLRQLRQAGPDALDGCNFSALRHIYLGSDSLSPDTLTEFIEVLGPYGLSAKALAPGYGMAEAVLLVTCTARETAPQFATLANGQTFTSVGAPLAGFDIKIVRSDGSECDAREVGSVQLRGDTLSSHYFESQHPLLDTQGYYVTGDLGFIENGQLHITGREGERFKINGQSYFLPQLEQTLQRHPAIRPGGIAALHHGDDLLILAEPASRPATVAQSTALKNELCSLLFDASGFKPRPDQIQWVARGQIQRTSSGKLIRHALHASLRDGEIKRLEPA